MRNMTKCPSPNGANAERLYIVRERDRLALDAAPPDAPDDNGASAYEELATFLQKNLSPDVLAEAETLLRQFVDQSGGGNLGTDEPEDFTGQPHPGGRMERNPQVGRVESNPAGFRPRRANVPRRTPHHRRPGPRGQGSSAADAPFGYRTPHANPGVEGDRGHDGQPADDKVHQGAAD